MCYVNLSHWDELSAILTLCLSYFKGRIVQNTKRLKYVSYYEHTKSHIVSCRSSCWWHLNLQQIYFHCVQVVAYLIEDWLSCHAALKKKKPYISTIYHAKMLNSVWQTSFKHESICCQTQGTTSVSSTSLCPLCCINIDTWSVAFYWTYCTGEFTREQRGKNQRRKIRGLLNGNI